MGLSQSSFGIKRTQEYAEYTCRDQRVWGALPNFHFYYWAANLSIIQYWLCADSLHGVPNLGITSFNDLYIEGSFASFQQLSAKFGIPKSNLFRYLQVCCFVRDANSQFPSQPVQSSIDTFLLLPPTKGTISCGYERIFSLKNSSLFAIKTS